MAHTDDLITAYLEELRRVVPANPSLVRTMLADTEAHLRDAADRHIADGVDVRVAAERAIADFGPPDVVARSFLGGGARLPQASGLSRWAGRAGVAGLVALIVGIVMLGTSIAEVRHEPGPGDDLGWGLSVGVTAAGVVLMLLAVVGMTVRLGRRLGRFGVLGNVVLLLAVPVSLPFGYGALFVLIALVALGFTLLAVPAYRAGDLPRAGIGLVLVGPLAAAVILAATELFDGDASEYLMLAVLPVVVGWAWMNVALAREPGWRPSSTPSDPSLA